MADLVLLKMSHKVPTHAGRQLGNFSSRFLNTTLTEQSLPGLNRLAHFLRWVRLRDRHQLDVVSRTTALRCGQSDSFAHPFEILQDRIHCRGFRRGGRLLFLYFRAWHKHRYNERCFSSGVAVAAAADLGCALFAGKSRQNHAEELDHETLFASSRNYCSSGYLFQFARPGESRPAS